MHAIIRTFTIIHKYNYIFIYTNLYIHAYLINNDKKITNGADLRHRQYIDIDQRIDDMD